MLSRGRDVNLVDSLEPRDLWLRLGLAHAQHLDLGAVGQWRDLRLRGERWRETSCVLGIVGIA